MRFATTIFVFLVGIFSLTTSSCTGGKPVTRWGYIDPKGQFIIQPQFDRAMLFSEGLAPVARIPADQKPYGLVEWEWGYIDKSGSLAIPMQFRGPNLKRLSVYLAFAAAVFPWQCGREQSEIDVLNYG